jgi:hypothetical protein
MTRYIANTLPLVVFVGLTVVTTTSHGASLTYTYDSLSRLTNAAYSDGSREAYSYDCAGNRIARMTSGPVDNIQPSVPTNLITLALAPGQCSLAWNPAYDTGGSGIAGYCVFLDGHWFTNTTAPNVLLSGLVPNAAYCVTVAAFDGATNVSTPSAPLCFQVPALNLSANPALTVNIFPTPSLSPNSPNWSAFCSNTISFLKSGQNLSSDRQSAANFTVSPQLESGDIIVSTTNSALWRGQLDPPAPFQNERGGYLRFAMRVVSQDPFNLDGVTWNYGASDSDDVFRYIDRLTNVSYGLGIQGLWYGPDGIKGTADDVWRSSGVGTQLINELYYVGPGDSRLGNDQNQLDAAIGYINDHLPLTLRCTFELFGTNSQLLISTFDEISTTRLADKRIALIATNNALNFGIVSLGGTSNLFLTVSNAGSTTLNLQGIGFPFGFSAMFPGRTLLPGQTTNIAVTFSPRANVLYGGRLSVISDATSGNDALPLYAAVAVPPTTNAPVISLDIFAMPIPAISSASFPIWRASVRQFLENSYPLPSDRALPQNFVIPASFDAGDIMKTTTTNINLWRGQINPRPPFAAEHGVFTGFGLRAVSAVPFNLAGVSWFIDCSVPGVMRYVGTNTSYGTGLIGLWYGPDGIKGTADDVWRISGSSAEPINECYYAGAGNSFVADTTNQIGIITNYVRLYSPFSVYCIYTVRDTNGLILATNVASALISPVPPDQVPRLRLRVSALQPSYRDILFNGMAGLFYQIQASASLTGWEPLGTTSSGSDAFSFLDNQSTNLDMRFYRVRLLP